MQEIDSLSRDGLVVVTLAFPWMTDVDLAILNVREGLDEVRDVLPETAGPPAVRRWDPGNRPFMVLAVSTADARDDSVAAAEARQLVALSRAVREILRPRLEQVDGVAAAELVGDRDEQVLVELDPARARLLDAAPAEAAEAIRRAMTVPESGTLRRGPYRYSLLVPALVQSADDLAAIVVSAPGGVPRVRQADVARVALAPSEPQSVLRFDGRPAVGLRLYKNAVGNALAVSDAVVDVLAAFRAENPDVRIDIAYARPASSAARWAARAVRGARLARAVALVDPVGRQASLSPRVVDYRVTTSTRGHSSTR